jgi:DNA end-binding protein Ku
LITILIYKKNKQLFKKNQRTFIYKINLGNIMHPLWKGFINFGLISIPIKLYSAVIEKEFEFHLFHKKDKGKIRYARICEKDNNEVQWEEIIKGYEYSKDKYILLEDEDLQKANLHKTNSIEIIDFVNQSEIDTVFYEKPYFLDADIKNKKPYFLLFEALKETKKVAIAKFVLHNHEHLAVIKPYSKILILNQLRYLNQIKSSKTFGISLKEKSPKEINIAIKLIEELSTKFNPKKYKDSYTNDLKKLINQKAKGKKIIPKGKKPIATKESDIEFLLKKSLQTKKRKIA